MRKLFERFKSMYCISILLSIVASILNVIGSYRLGSLLTEETSYKITVCSEIRSYTDKDRSQAPQDSNVFFEV